MEQRITKLNWKRTMYIAVKCRWIFIFILLCLIFSRFLILFIYTITSDIGKFIYNIHFHFWMPGVHCSRASSSESFLLGTEKFWSPFPKSCFISKSRKPYVNLILWWGKITLSLLIYSKLCKNSKSFSFSWKLSECTLWKFLVPRPRGTQVTSP